MTTDTHTAATGRADDSAVAVSRRKAVMALFALGLGGFGIGLTEFVIAGLLTEVSDDLRVSITAAGHLVGAYALAVVPGALIITRS